MEFHVEFHVFPQNPSAPGRMVEAGEDLTAADAEIEDGDVVSLFQ